MIREHCQDPVMRWNKTNRFVKAIRLIPEQRELRRGHSVQVLNSEKVQFFVKLKVLKRNNFKYYSVISYYCTIFPFLELTMKDQVKVRRAARIVPWCVKCERGTLGDLEWDNCFHGKWKRGHNQKHLVEHEPETDTTTQ